ncbi:IS1595 family transposase [Nitrobacter sp.]|uniref:IS1595 family transposase n=1 Tax=Nitrobacter sp. TaxID=29420 RepID=UPI003F653A6E
MANSVLSDVRFHNEDAAFEYVEAQLWPNGPVCPHCGNADSAKIGRLQGKTTRVGLRKCYECRKPFTVRMGSIFEESKLPLRFWLQAIHLLCASKKGISTRQLQRMLGCGMKTAWFLGHRIRHAMAPGGDVGPLGGAGKTVVADETELARSKKTRRSENFRRKTHNPIVVSLVERDGAIRSTFLDHRMVMSVVRQNVHPDSRFMTDSAQHYKHAPVAKHEFVDHSKFEWTRGDVSTNELEGFFSVLKRGLVGTYQHVDKKHLDRYLAEFDFRQNTRAKLGVDDEMRADLALRSFVGKRLTYAATNSAEEA